MLEEKKITIYIVLPTERKVLVLCQQKIFKSFFYRSRESLAIELFPRVL